MRDMHEGMKDDLGFRTLYASPSGSAIVEVIHEVSKNADERVHPSSYMAFVNLQALPVMRHWFLSMKEAVKGEEFYQRLKGVWLGNLNDIEYFMTPTKSAEPDMGFYYDTEWAARTSVNACEDPFNLYLAVVKVAKEERETKGRELARQHRSKHFDKLAEAIDKSKARGKLPVNTVTFVEEIGGGLQALAVHFIKGPENTGAGYEKLYLWLTDFEGIMVGIYNGSEEDEVGSVITLKGEKGFEDPPSVRATVEALEGLVQFGRLFSELY